MAAITTKSAEVGGSRGTDLAGGSFRALLPVEATWRPEPSLRLRSILPWLVVAALAGGLALTVPTLTQVVILVAIAVPVLALALRAPRHLVLGLAIWLAGVGLLRRLLYGLGSHALLGDPLLVVEALVMVLLVGVAISRGAGRGRTRLANAVLVLCLLALVEAANPLQGGISVGIGGLLLVLVPLLAFWVGRSLADDRTMRHLLILLAVLAVLASIYGLLQTLAGFPPWDQHWIQVVTSNGTYAALNVGGVIRAFSSFSSSAEYASFLGVGVVAWFALGRRRALVPLVLAAIALLGTAIVLDSSRGIVVLSVVALGVMMAARARMGLVPAALAGLAAVAVLVVALSHLAPQHLQAAGGTAALVNHQVSGLSQPLNPQSSTLRIHLQELGQGLRSGFTNPIGHGTGSITLAASKFGGSAQGTEVDPSNAAVAWGLAGLAAYLVVVLVGLTRAYRLAAGRRDFLALAILGLLVVTLLQWLNGGQYAVAWLPWLALGWVDRSWVTWRNGPGGAHNPLG
jgi:hypothetical protein